MPRLLGFGLVILCLLLALFQVNRGDQSEPESLDTSTAIDPLRTVEAFVSRVDQPSVVDMSEPAVGSAEALLHAPLKLVLMNPEGPAFSAHLRSATSAEFELEILLNSDSPIQITEVPIGRYEIAYSQEGEVINAVSIGPTGETVYLGGSGINLRLIGESGPEGGFEVYSASAEHDFLDHLGTTNVHGVVRVPSWVGRRQGVDLWFVSTDRRMVFIHSAVGGFPPGEGMSTVAIPDLQAAKTCVVRDESGSLLHGAQISLPLREGPLVIAESDVQGNLFIPKRGGWNPQISLEGFRDWAGRSIPAEIVLKREASTPITILSQGGAPVVGAHLVLKQKGIGEGDLLTGGGDVKVLVSNNGGQAIADLHAGKTYLAAAWHPEFGRCLVEIQADNLDVTEMVLIPEDPLYVVAAGGESEGKNSLKVAGIDSWGNTVLPKAVSEGYKFQNPSGLRELLYRRHDGKGGSGWRKILRLPEGRGYLGAFWGNGSLGIAGRLLIDPEVLYEFQGRLVSSHVEKFAGYGLKINSVPGASRSNRTNWPELGGCRPTSLPGWVIRDSINRNTIVFQDGTFRFESLPPGEYLLKINPPQYGGHLFGIGDSMEVTIPAPIGLEIQAPVIRYLNLQVVDQNSGELMSTDCWLSSRLQGTGGTLEVPPAKVKGGEYSGWVTFYPSSTLFVHGLGYQPAEINSSFLNDSNGLLKIPLKKLSPMSVTLESGGRFGSTGDTIFGQFVCKYGEAWHEFYQERIQIKVGTPFALRSPLPGETIELHLTLPGGKLIRENGIYHPGETWTLQ